VFADSECFQCLQGIALLDQFQCFAVDGFEPVLQAHLHRHTAVADQAHHDCGIVQRGGHRFFQINGFSGGQRPFEQLPVSMVGRGDDKPV